MARTKLDSFFDQLGDHVADYGEGQDQSGKRRDGRRRRKKDDDVEINPHLDQLVVPPSPDKQFGAVRIEKNLPLLKELVAFVLNNKPGGWITPREGVQIFLPASFSPRFILVQGDWKVDLLTSPVELKVRKSILGATISYPTALTGISITAAGVAVQLKNCPDLLISHAE